MPWKVKGLLLNSDGSIYAGRGAILEDDDEVALKHPNMVTAVHGDSALVIPAPTVIVSDVPAEDSWEEADEEEDEYEADVPEPDLFEL